MVDVLYIVVLVIMLIVLFLVMLRVCRDSFSVLVLLVMLM